MLSSMSETGKTLQVKAARAAKEEAKARFGHLDAVSSIGIGMTEDRSRYAITISVSDEGARIIIPASIAGVPVRTALVSRFRKMRK
jgi:hypothetical protein